MARIHAIDRAGGCHGGFEAGVIGPAGFITRCVSLRVSAKKRALLIISFFDY
jgi:hypothetical protein